jgi:hypothetical protein
MQRFIPDRDYEGGTRQRNSTVSFASARAPRGNSTSLRYTASVCRMTSLISAVPFSAIIIGGAWAEILVELQLLAAFSVGTGMIRSRAASAPYAIAANRSSWVSAGYSASNSASVIPSARKSRISETQIRVPFIQGLPPQILGSIEIRSRSGFTRSPLTLYRGLLHLFG